jgi:peptidoglycan hydrolase CwlO-like protein
MANAIAEQDALHAQVAKDADKAAREAAELTAENRAAAKEEYDDSERGDVARQIAEAERVMRLPTPEALKAMGSVVPKDPTRFPSD